MDPVPNLPNRHKFSHYIFPAILVLGFLHGLIYVFLIPPWQHYDEPGQFEYVWMIAHSTSIPKAGMYDNSVRLKILDSMKAHDFFNSPALQELAKNAANLDPVWIGVTQVGDPPIYYWLAALPVRILPNAPIETQLYAARLVSLLIWLGVLYVAWLFSKEITPPNHPLRWMLPGSLALLPAFVEHSTAVNNDIAATLVYSLIILFGIRLIKNRFSIINVFVLSLLLILSYFTKASIWLSVLLIPLGFFFAGFRNRRFIFMVGFLLAVAIVSTIAIFEFNDVALWYRETSQAEPTKVETKYGTAIQIVDNEQERSNVLQQEIVSAPAIDLKGKQVTIGVWMWGQGNLPTYPPSILIITNELNREFLRPEPVALSSTPTFTSYGYRIPESFLHLYIVLEPFINHEGTGTVYFQNPVLVEGELSSNSVPVLSDHNTKVGWDGQIHLNLIRNSDSRSIWPRFRPGIIVLMNKVDYRIGEAANWLISSLDLQANFWYTRETVKSIFRSFWGTFSWGQIRWEGRNPYALPFLFTMIGLIPGFAGFLKNVPKYKLVIMTWLGFAILGIFFYSWFTGISSQSFFYKPIYPDARYIFPTVIILMGFVVSGWELILSAVSPKFRKYAIILYFLFFVYIDWLSFYTIQNYYRM